MEPNLNMVIDQVGRDKNIDRSVLMQALEQAILTAAKKTFGVNREMEAQYNEDTGCVDLFLIVNVVEGATGGWSRSSSTIGSGRAMSGSTTANG